MFRVIFIFSDWILIKKVIVSSTYLVLVETDFQKIRGIGPWVKMNIINAFSRNVNTINWKIFLTYGGIYRSDKTQQAFLERDKTLTSLRKYEKTYPWGESWKTRVVNSTVYQFLGSKLEFEIFLKKREHQKKGALKQKTEAA